MSLSHLLTDQGQHHGRNFLPWLTLGFTAIVTILYAVFDGTPALLVYDRTAIEDGEVWRLVSGHLVHLDLSHFAINLTAFALLATGYQYIRRDEPQQGGLHLTVFLLAAMMGISASIYALTPQTLTYCGISAALNALYASVTLRFWKRTKDPIWLFLLLGSILKIAWEAAFGSLISQGLAWPPHYTAHFTGLIIGLLEAGLFTLSRTKKLATTSKPVAAERGREGKVMRPRSNPN